jgi:hypothetical protein
LTARTDTDNERVTKARLGCAKTCPIFTKPMKPGVPPGFGRGGSRTLRIPGVFLPQVAFDLRASMNE